MTQGDTLATRFHRGGRAHCAASHQAPELDRTV